MEKKFNTETDGGRERERSLKGKRRRERRCAGASQAERTGPLSTTVEEQREEREKEKTGLEKWAEKVRDGRRRGGRGEESMKSLLSELRQIPGNSWRSAALK